MKWIGSLFGYDICVGNDVIHMFDTDKVPHNCILIFEIEKVGFEEMKKKMRQTVIHHIKRYRQVPVNYLGFYFWKEVDKDLAKEQIKRWEKRNTIKAFVETLRITKNSIIFRGDYDKGYKFFIADENLFLCILIYSNKNIHFQWITKKYKKYKIIFSLKYKLY